MVVVLPAPRKPVKHVTGIGMIGEKRKEGGGRREEECTCIQ